MTEDIGDWTNSGPTIYTTSLFEFHISNIERPTRGLEGRWPYPLSAEARLTGPLKSPLLSRLGQGTAGRFSGL